MYVGPIKSQVPQNSCSYFSIVKCTTNALTRNPRPSYQRLFDSDPEASQAAFVQLQRPEDLKQAHPSYPR